MTLKLVSDQIVNNDPLASSLTPMKNSSSVAKIGKDILSNSQDEISGFIHEYKRLDKEKIKARSIVLSMPFGFLFVKMYDTKSSKEGVALFNAAQAEPDQKKVLELYLQAAIKGNVDAMNCLGDRFFTGSDTESNKMEAAKWYKLATDHNDAKGMYHLARCCTDEKEAFNWYKLSADRGHVDARYRVAVCYEKGYGCSIDLKEAAKYYKLATFAGNTDGIFKLAVFYEKGYGISKNEREAALLFRLAAQKGHNHARYKIGACLEKGIGVSKDEKDAARWYQHAADGNDPYAMNSLGEMHLKGTAVEKNKKKAFGWFFLSSTKGLTKGLCNLGMCHQMGIGCQAL